MLNLKKLNTKFIDQSNFSGKKDQQCSAKEKLPTRKCKTMKISVTQLYADEICTSMRIMVGDMK